MKVLILYLLSALEQVVWLCVCVCVYGNINVKDVNLFGDKSGRGICKLLWEVINEQIVNKIDHYIIPFGIMTLLYVCVC